MTSNRTTLAGTALSLAAVASLHAAPLVALNDNLNLFFVGQATARYESNFLLANEDYVDPVTNQPYVEEEGDMIFIFSPGFSLEAGERNNTAAFATFTVREHFKMYLDHSEYDSELFDASLRGGYDTQRIKLTGSLRYYEDDQPTAGTTITGYGSAPVERDIFHGRSYGEYTISPKTSVGVGFNYFNREFENDVYTDTSHWEVPADFYYSISPKIDLSAGVRYRNNEVENDTNNSEDYFFNVGVRGDLTPKLIGSARIGYQIRDFDAAGAGEEGQLALSSDLTYNIGPRSRVTLLASRDFGSAAVGGSSIEDTNARISYYYAITPMWTVFSMLSYQLSEYNTPNVADPREDDTYNLGFGATYSPNSYLTLEARYNFALNESNRRVEYENHIFSVSASLRY